MATLVLTTVGSLIGGPVGGAIGAALGSQVDRALLGPSRKGPRLSDLSIQTSTYGAQIPKLFGTMRVAGTVIWATDLREDTHRTRSKAGKTTTYSYSASLAVALSARPIRGVGRIWADGKLLRGADGGFRTETGFRIHHGGEDQPIDPLIGSAQGIASTPAHRGLAYVVFDTLQLADFGNRIPSLSFEVIADEGAVPVGEIAKTLSVGVIVGDDGIALDGYAASGDSVRGAIQALEAVIPLPLLDDGTRLQIGDAGIVAIDPTALGTGTGEERQPKTVRDRKATRILPDTLAIAYREPARDYQAGLQRACRDGVGRRSEELELPAAISAAMARGLAEATLARRWAARESATLHLPWRYGAVRAGGRVTLDGRIWRVAGWGLEKMALRLTLAPDTMPLRPVAAMPGVSSSGDAGPIGNTILRLFDLPSLGDDEPASPRIFAAACGTAAGWRRAELALSLDGGASWQAAGRTALPAVLGTVIDPPRSGPRELFDRDATLTVDLVHEGMVLAGADRRGLVAGGNLAMVGGELLQFGGAEQIGPTRWRLSQLLRGRRGTEDAIAGHGPGEDFVLIEAATLQPIDVPLSAIGSAIRVSAIGPGDAVAIERSLGVLGRAVRPPAPVRLRAAITSDGALNIDWIRRSRTGWTWADGADTPTGQDGERYRLSIGTAGVVRTVETDASAYVYPAGAWAADGIAGAVAIRVVQLGARGASPAATLDIML